MESKFYQADEHRAEKVQVLFATIARRYDLLNDIMSAGLHRRWKRRLVELADARTEGGTRKAGARSVLRDRGYRVGVRAGGGGRDGRGFYGRDVARGGDKDRERCAGCGPTRWGCRFPTTRSMW